jgi:hypothetical protein
MQFSPPSRHLFPLRSKYPPQHHVLKHRLLTNYCINLRICCIHSSVTYLQLSIQPFGH